MADRDWTAECVADHFEEAFRTLRKLPPVKAQGYFNTWPAIVRTSREIAAMEPQPMRIWPSAAAITRLEQTFDWVLWIEEAERKLVWARAALRYGMLALTILLFLLSIRRAGERAGRMAERIETTENAHDIHRQMLDAAARRPRNRSDLADRLRDGRF